MKISTKQIGPDSWTANVLVPSRERFFTVIGTYKSEAEAINAAKMLCEMTRISNRRLCTPEDIDAVRREFAT